ncbi:lipase family protein [Nocardia takedensis]|uniref:lipase family protein n=1 Tax=Nocardia takedensis TaxID=259390 RepID=UPI0002FA9979|nr:lipase family protein [Nocardia takedensis]
MRSAVRRFGGAVRCPRVLAAVAAVLALLVATGCAESGRESAVPRGEVVSVEPLKSLSQPETAAYLGRWSIETPVRNGVEAYRVVYRTVDPHGDPITASGLVALPTTEQHRLRVVSYAHGTIVRRDEAPSADSETDRVRTLMFAAAGHAAVAPDYLGLGSGPGRHPYLHAGAEASASLDLLRAARAVAADKGRELAPEVLVTGYSQGGHAAAALARALHDRPGDFTLGALSAISGPYAPRAVQNPASFDGRVTPRNAVVFLTYWITAMNTIFHLYDDPAEAFREPYAARVGDLFDGDHDLLSISGSLPAAPADLLTPEFRAWADDPTGAALRALDASEGVCDWTADVPVRLSVSSADRSVPPENADHCLRTLRGDRVERVDLGPIDHGATARVGLALTLEWFDQLTAAH